MFNAFLTLFTALSMATVAAWFAIAGIMAVFAGAPIPALIMGCVIELGKVVGVSWVYRHWKERTSIKFFMLPAVIVAMFLTSMGIFGFLSKAHLEQNADVGNNTLQIERLDQRISRQQAVISREQDKIDNADSVIQQLDDTVATLIEFDKISDPVNGARAVRERQQPQRDALAAEITTAQNNIDAAEDAIGDLQDERLILSQEVRELELEIGPIKYIAELVYENPENSFEDAVRLVIIAFIFVFDPMAILLLMGANYQFLKLRDVGLHMIEPDEPKEEDRPDPEDPDDPGGELLDLFEVDDHEESEPEPEPEVQKVETVEEPKRYDREWLDSIPQRDENIDNTTLINAIRRLEGRDRSADEHKIYERFRNLAKARNVPWDVAKRAVVSTDNALLRE